ncbi:MAG: vitamin K epoxide reductase family protein [Gemmatimonadaceae bacterium]
MAALALAGIFLALYLLFYKLGMLGSLTCSVGSCETVNTSKWATFLGFPVAGWGVAWYVTAFVVSLAGTTERFADSRNVSLVLVGLTGSGLLFSAYLTWLELFVIHAICQWCVVSAIIVLAMFVMAVLDFRDTSSFTLESEQR